MENLSRKEIEYHLHNLVVNKNPAIQEPASKALRALASDAVTIEFVLPEKSGGMKKIVFTKLGANMYSPAL